jgi:hypothetical protein
MNKETKPPIILINISELMATTNTSQIKAEKG